MGYTFTFGKHRGEDIEDVPTSYLQWVSENFDDNEDNEALLEEVDEEIDRRVRCGLERDERPWWER